MLLKVRHARTELVFLSTHAASRAIFLPGELFPQVRPCLPEKGLCLLVCGHDAPKIQSSLEEKEVDESKIDRTWPDIARNVTG